MFISTGPENTFEKIQYPFLIKNQKQQLTKMEIGRHVLNMTKKKYTYIKTQSKKVSMVTKTCPDLTVKESAPTMNGGTRNPRPS